VIGGVAQVVESALPSKVQSQCSQKKKKKKKPNQKEHPIKQFLH
jgi:hypothetical protein